MAEQEGPKRAKPASVKYEPATLIAQAATFKTTPELMSGALYGVSDELTRDEAAKRLEEFLTREVSR